MKNKILQSVFILTLLFVGARYAHAACGDSITGGSGTVGSPYLISTPTELAAISNCLGAGNSSKYFRLDSNIDLNVSPYNTGTGWTPIGTSGNGFYGKFDGDFYTISNLYFNSSATSYAGLFGYLSSGSTVSDLLLSNTVVSGNYGVGALAGVSYGAISKVGVTDGSVTGIQRVGGLIGSSYGSITQSYSDNTVYFNPTSSPTCCVGGLIGESYSGGSVNNSYSRSNIIMTYNVYNQGAAGGLYGNDYTSSTKTLLYSTGSITMVSGSLPSSVGGLGGSNYTSTTSSYWDTQTSGLSTSSGGAGVVGKTTSQMKTQGTYSGWDFSTIWAIDGVNNDGYPYLLWQSYADVTAPTITNVSSDKANGTYTTGEVIDIDVTFSEAVTSTGDVTVTLETGDTDRTCTFSVSATTTGTCNYTVQAGDTSSDLTVSSISGTIADASLNAMSNFVPTTNLAANKAIVIDTTAPTVTSVSSDKANGTYLVGEVIDIDVTFSEVVTSTGSVTITLETGDTDRTCTFTVTASATGTCNYTVTSGDTSSDLTVNSISGTISDTALNAISNFVPVTNLAANKALVIDALVPSVSIFSPLHNATGISRETNLVVTFDQIVDVETGNIVIKKLSDDSTVETIDVTGGQVTGTGTTTITINPSVTLAGSTEYYITIDATAFDDVSGNSFAGISNSSTWKFTIASSGGISVSPPPTCSISAFPQKISLGSSSDLTIKLGQAGRESPYYIVFENDGSRYEKDQTISVSPLKTTEYQFAVVNMSGAQFCSVTISVENVVPSVIEPEIVVQNNESETIQESSNLISQSSEPMPTNTNGVVLEKEKVELKNENTSSVVPRLTFNRVLKRKHYGPDVLLLQKTLNVVTEGNLEEDGIFGSRTEKIVRAVQQNAGVRVDGIVGKETRGVIQNFDFKKIGAR
jgi:hypothetical protein